MATTFDRHYLQPVLAHQQVGTSRQRVRPESQITQTNGISHNPAAMSPSSQSTSHSQQSGAAFEPNMADELAGGTAQSVSPAKGGRGGRIKGRGGRPATKSKAKTAKVSKAAANPKQGAGRGRRQKVYEFLKAQAAHERMAELKSQFTQLARAMKPALNELADRTLSKLNNDPAAHDKVPESQDVHQFLDQRLKDTMATADIAHKMQVDTATKMYKLNSRLARDECTGKILDAECEMYDSLLVKLDRLEYLHDNKLPTNLPDVSYDYKAITQQQVDQQGPYVYHNEQGVPVPCSERVVPLSHIMNDSYQFADEHRGKRKAEEEPEGQPGAKRQGLLGLDDDVSRRTSALMSAHDDVAEEGRSVTPGEEQQEVTRKPTRAAPRARASAKQPSTTSNGVVPEEKEEDLLDVEEVNGLPLPKGASLPDEYGVRIITKSRKVEYANNRIMAPVASPFEDFQIGYRDSSNNPLKGATKARRREYLGLPNSNAAFYDRRVANYNSVLQKEEDYDKELVEKHKLHPTLGIFMPDSINSEEYPAERHLQEYNPVVQVGPKGQIFHASRSVLRYRLDQEANRIKERLRLKASVANFLAEEGVTQGEVALPKEVVQQHREEVLKARSIDPATLPEPLKLPSVSPSPKVMEEEEADVAMDRHRAIEELLQAADQVESDEHASRMAGNTAAHKSSRPYDAIRDVFTENAPPVAPAPLPVPAPAVAVEPPAANTFNLSFLAEVAEDPARAEEIRREELRRAQEMINEVDIQQQAGMAEPPREGQPPYGPPPVEASVMDPRLFPSQDIPHGNVPNATAEASRPQYYDPPQPSPYQSHEVSSQWHREEPPVQLAPHPRSNDFLRTALNPQTPPPHYPVSQYPPPPEYPGPHLAPAPATQVPYNAASQRGSLPALRPVRAAYEDGTVAPEYHGSPGPANRPGMVLSNNGAYYAPPPARPFHNGYMIDEQQQLHHHQQVGPPVHHQPVHPMTAQGPYPAAPDSGYPYPPLAPAPAYHPIGPYHPLAAHPLTPGPPLARGPPGSSSRPYRKLEPAPAQSATKPRGNAQRPELRTVQFDYREGIKDYIPIEAPPVHGPSAIRGWSHQNLKQRRVSKEMPAPAPTDESS